MRKRGFRKVVPLVALALATGGCLVTASTYEAKTREADTLREAVASANKEKSALEARLLASEKQITDMKEENAILSARNQETAGELRSAKEELASVVGKYEGTRITREELISELLEKEKATGKRIQELNAGIHACEAERERLHQEAAAREAALSELRKRVEDSSDAESLRRERDILLGRVERLKEERLKEARRRDARFAELEQTLSGISSRIAVETAGHALRVLVPEQILFRKGKSSLTDAGRKMIGEVGKTASEFPSSSLLITAGRKSHASAILSALTKGHALNPSQVVAGTGTGGRGIELMVVIP